MFWHVGAKRHPFPWEMHNIWIFANMLKLIRFLGIYVKFTVFYENAEPVPPNAEILQWQIRYVLVHLRDRNLGKSPLYQQGELEGLGYR